MASINNKSIDPLNSINNLHDISNIIAIVGLTGSGKSVATEFFEKKGFFKIRFGQITMDTAKERGLEINEKNEREIREGLRREFGMGAYAIKNIPKIEAGLAQGKNIVLDGLYSWSEYKILKERFSEQLKILAINSSPSVRYQRLGARAERPLTTQEASSRDFSEIENIEKAGPIAIADFYVNNDGNIEVLNAQLEKVYSELLRKGSTAQDQKSIVHIRPSKIDYYLDIAKSVCKRSTCLRRRFGAVIVSKSDKIIATGYNGAIRKARDCLEIGQCMRQALKIPPGQRYELCKSFHAEQNAILSADPAERRGSTLYLHGENADSTLSYGEPCMMCKRTIVQGEIGRVIARQPDGSYREWDVNEFVMEENVGKNFPDEIKKSKEFREYIKKLEK